MRSKTLYAEALSFSHKSNGSIHSWQGFQFSIQQGEAISIIGSSGIGKTTLLRVLSGLHKYDTGKVYIDSIENEVKQPNSPIFIVFQDYNLTLLPWLTIESNINLGIHKSPESNHSLLEFLSLLFPKTTDFQKLLNSYPDQLSGGQKQRIQIARALISNSDFIFFDEPDTGIDFKNKLLLREILLNLVNKKSKGVVLITHDLENAYELSNRFYVIYKSIEKNTIQLIELNKTQFRNLDNFRTCVLQYI